MKILVMNNDLTERSVIQQVLQRNGHEVVSAENSQAAWTLLQEGKIRFVIADRTTTDVDEKHFVEHVHSSKFPAHIYILLISTKVYDQEMARGAADDYIFKPVSPADLKSRVIVGERILALADNLLQAKGQLESMSIVDPVTNFLNQRAFLSSAYAELERARRNQAPLSVFVLHINNLKNLNTPQNVMISDDVLRVIAQVIREKCRPYDCIGRWDGEEFAAAFAGVIGSDAEKIAERVINGIRSMRITATNDGPPINVELSAGVAAAARISAATEVEPLIDQARQSMLRAKEAGGNQVYLAYI
ncbi:MAG TPA: diguanylate cyclase [Anaerolineales bacterium]|nr:diguanylate cyclase [Anaerolineales bacterium]